MNRNRGDRQAQVLLAHAEADPAFDGNFEAIAERLGWTSGRLWRQNPSIRRASERWEKMQLAASNTTTTTTTTEPEER